MTAAFVALGAALGGLLFRVRGGLGDIGHVPARLAWAGGLGLYAGLLAADWRLGAGVALGLLVGVFDGWRASIDLGRREGRAWRDWVHNAARGVEFVAGASVVVWLLGYGGAPWLAAAGLLCPVAYELGWRTPLAVPGLTKGPEVGEVYFGALVGAALGWTVLA